MVLTVLPEQEVVDPRHIQTKKPNGHRQERRDKKFLHPGTTEGLQTGSQQVEKGDQRGPVELLEKTDFKTPTEETFTKQ